MMVPGNYGIDGNKQWFLSVECYPEIRGRASLYLSSTIDKHYDDTTTGYERPEYQEYHESMCV